MSLFISFEGGDGAGKSTQAALLAERLRAEGHTVCAVREPGGTPLGEYLRSWVKASDRETTAEAELLLFAAARAQLVRQVIEPALTSGAVVVADRYADSTTAYQGHGRGLPLRRVATTNALATGGRWPDLSVLLDVAPATGLARGSARDASSAERRFEDADTAFHRRVRAGFKRIARREPGRWLIVDASQPAGDVAAAVWARVQMLLPR